jgi:hypothetical protein
MIRIALLLVSLALVWLCAGCASKVHPPEVDTADIQAMAVIVTQEAGQPISLTLVESEVTRHLYRQFRLVTRGQLESLLGGPRLSPGMLFDPDICAEIERLTGVDAILQVTVTGHDIEWTTTQRYRAHVGLAMQLLEVPAGTVRWSRSVRRTETADTISGAVHEAVSDAVWECLKYLVGWESIVSHDDLVRVCSRTGLQLETAADSCAGGLKVREVAQASVWDRAGLRAGDVIARVNGQPISEPGVEWPAGRGATEVSITVRRGQALLEVSLPLDEDLMLPTRSDLEH